MVGYVPSLHVQSLVCRISVPVWESSHVEGGGCGCLIQSLAFLGATKTPGMQIWLIAGVDCWVENIHHPCSCSPAGMRCVLRQKSSGTSARREGLSGIMTVSMDFLPQVLLILLIFFPCPFYSRGPLHLFSCFAEQCCTQAGALFFLDPTTQSLSGMFLQLFALQSFGSLFLQDSLV